MRLVKKRLQILTFVVCTASFMNASGCGSFHDQKKVRLRDGREITVSYGTEIVNTGERIFVVEFRNDSLVRRVRTIENDVYDIWHSISGEAEKEAVEEALIRYSFFTGRQNDQGQGIYESRLFSAERTEAGKWSLRKLR